VAQVFKAPAKKSWGPEHKAHHWQKKKWKNTE
jgi:hypothetical protein